MVLRRAEIGELEEIGINLSTKKRISREHTLTMEKWGLSMKEVKSVSLAYRIYPEPQGTNYYHQDLLDENRLGVLFDYCQIGEAVIFEVGWQTLIDHYGYESLFQINNKSGWFDCDNIQDFIKYIEAYREDISRIQPN